MSDAVKTIDEFLAIVRRSGLVDASELDAATAAWPDRSLPLPDALVESLVEGELLTRWQADQLRKGRHKGFVLGKYKLLRLLGAGGMSSVYLAEHATLHNKVAIKVLPIKRVDQTSYLARFEREARQSARLSHPNIVRVFDLDTSGAIHFIAMEYLDGTDLHAKVKADGPLDVRTAVEYVRQAALGLQHAHDEGLVHRDIKPANLMLDRRGTVKILDLGLALARDDDDAASLTREHDEKVLGTADYLAPEQATDSHKADRRSDIYSLGCTLYYLLVGKAPFASGKLAERIKAHVTKPAPNLLDQRPDVPPAIVELYFRMLEKHPDARPQSAQEIADTAGRWLALNPASAASSRPEAPRRPPPRRASQGGGSGSTSPATVTRSGPGSGSEMAIGRSGPLLRTGGSGVDSGALAFTPPPSSGSRATVTSADDGLPVVVDAAAAKRPAEREAARPGRHDRPGEIGGLPLGFWLVLVGGLILAGVLGYLVMAKRANAADQPAAGRMTQGPLASS